MPAPNAPDNGKIHDPVFLCMIGAIILAVFSSIALGTFISGAGPAPARADAAATDQPSPHPGNSLVNADPK